MTAPMLNAGSGSVRVNAIPQIARCMLHQEPGAFTVDWTVAIICPELIIDSGDFAGYAVTVKVMGFMP